MKFNSLKETIKIIWYFFKPYKGHTLGVIFLMFLSGVMESLNLAALYPIINYGLDLEKEGKVMLFFDRVLAIFGNENKFVSACILLMVLTILSTGIKILYNYFMNRLIALSTAFNQKSLFEHFSGHAYAYFVEKQQGNMVYGGTIAPIGVLQIILCSLRLANNLIVSFFFGCLLFVLAWQGMIAISGIGLFYILFIKRITTRMVTVSANLAVNEDTKKNIILNEFFTGIKTIKAYFGVPIWQKKFGEAVEKSVHHNFRMMMGRTYPETFMKFTFFMLIGIAGIFFGMKNPQNVLLMIPVLGTFVAVASRLLPYLNLVGNDLVNISRFMPDTKIVYSLLHEEITPVREGPKKFEKFKDKITFDHVSFKYPNMEGFLLKDISFSIEKNRMTAIVGSSGSGKTSIVNLLLRLYEPHKGMISIDRTPFGEMELSSYLGKIGYVSQESFIFNGTIAENIRFGLTHYSDDEVVEASKLSNAHEFILNLEGGYQTIVGDAGMKLSGGQRQRLAIARAMLRTPEIMILDEATSSLDNISEKNVQEAINKISNYTTVIVIAHRLSTVQNADTIIVLDQGQVLEQGTHEDLLRREKAYFGLYKNS